jgi:hypothetical protein
MKIHWNRFNIYLLLALAGVLTGGCHTEKGQQKKQVSTLHLHQEMNPDPTGRTEQVPIYREHPIMITVAKEPFLTEVNIKDAKVIDVVGGFALRVEFDRQGNWLLQQYTAASRGRRIAIFCQFVTPPEQDLNAGWWLAAPKINMQITDGVLIFTPDATRYDAEHIAMGLKNVAKQTHSSPDSNW